MSISVGLATRGYQSTSASVGLATRGYQDTSSDAVVLSDDTYKAKLLRRTIARPFSSLFDSVAGSIFSAIGDSDNDIGGLFGIDDFLPDKDFADTTVYDVTPYPSTPTVTLVVPELATTSIDDGIDTYKEKLMRRGFPAPFRATYLSTLGSVLSAVGGSDNDVGGLFGADDFLGVVP